jgi:hypothetical protein
MRFSWHGLIVPRWLYTLILMHMNDEMGMSYESGWPGLSAYLFSNGSDDLHFVNWST